MTTFTTEEQNLICLYDPGSREGLIHELHEMQKDLMPDEEDLEALTRSVLAKLERMTDAEYFEITEALNRAQPPQATHPWMGFLPIQNTSVSTPASFSVLAHSVSAV